jgi:sulfur relay (sulfurtransferase) complex TusBCD TusD component (DsrE family)
MPDNTTLTFCLMDPPFENGRTTTALRLIDIAARRGYDIRVFAYEGAVAIPFSKQRPHGNAVHGHSETEEDHPLPREWVAAVTEAAAKNGGSIEWINCGLCVDERGVDEAIEGVRRGTPGDLWKWAESSTNTLIIPTR